MAEEPQKRYTGGCLCGALRYEAQGEPLNMVVLLGREPPNRVA